MIARGFSRIASNPDGTQQRLDKDLRVLDDMLFRGGCNHFPILPSKRYVYILGVFDLLSLIYILVNMAVVLQ